MRCFAPSTPARLLRIPLRFASTSSPAAKPPPRSVEATTFSSPSVPKEVYDRPEPIRGLPLTAKLPPSPSSPDTAPGMEPGSSLVQGSTTNKFALAALENPHRFEGPARPRLLFNSQQRELPKAGVRGCSLLPPFWQTADIDRELGELAKMRVFLYCSPDKEANAPQTCS